VDAGGASDEGACLRTGKSCGPDASTLASSSWEVSFLGATVTKKPDHRGEREVVVREQASKRLSGILFFECGGV
jgi:hypothetical protein